LIVKTVTRARRLARFGLSLIRLGRSQRRRRAISDTEFLTQSVALPPLPARSF
jgi:hypothetical protein